MDTPRAAITGEASRRVVLLTALAVLTLAPPTAQARVNVLVRHVGIPTLDGDAIRAGAWAPIVVDIWIESDDVSFDGTLKIAQLDNDGDRCYDTAEVHLQADGADTQRRYLYILPNLAHGRSSFAVETYKLDADGMPGEIVEVLSDAIATTRAMPKRQPLPVPDDHLVILSIGSGAIGRISDLSGNDQQTMHARVVHVGHMEPKYLPELWIGLEAVDYIVWDDADPDTLTPAQLEALLEWTRQGGTLLIAAAKTAGALAQCAPIKEVLPVTLGDNFSTRQFPELRRQLLDALRSQRGPYSTDLEAVRCRPRPGARVVHYEEEIDLPVITRQRVGRGHVIFSAVVLRDLFSSDGGSPAGFFRKVLCLKEPAPGEEQATAESIFKYVAGVTAFTTSSSLYLIIAVLFSIAYVGVATFGTWGFLSTKGLRQHSWSVFALVAIVASLLSIAAVKSVRGIEDKLHQLTIVDLESGNPYGYATAQFGLKTSSDLRLDVWLPSDHLSETEPAQSRCYVRPTAASPAGEDVASYADPVEYELVPGSAQIKNLRVRSTLKRLEGRWEGPIGGTVRGTVTVRNYGYNDWRFTKDSFIINELGVDLQGCWILHPVQDSYAQEGRLHKLLDRGDDIYAYPIGEVPSNGTRVTLHGRCYQPVGDETIPDVMAPCRLAVKQDQEWVKPFRNLLRGFDYGTGSTSGATLGREVESALLLLSTIGEYNPVRNAKTGDYLFQLKTFSRDRLRQLDLREQLQRDCIYLIGFADDPGPVRLRYRRGQREFRTMNPEEGRAKTMYRIRIPITVLDDRSAWRAKEKEKDEGGNMKDEG